MSVPGAVAAGRLVDTGLDRSVVLGFSRIGYAVRRRLPGWPADPPGDALRGRHVAVTGATSGLGMRTVRDVVALGGTAHLVVRDADKAAAVVAAIAAELPGTDERMRVWRCDVGDLDSVRAFADAFTRSGPEVPLHALVHNAGLMPPRWTASPQGHELTMAVHVLGPVLMTDLLARAGRTPERVVLVTSGGMYTQRLPVDHPDLRSTGYDPPVAYARSKRVQVELLPLLQERWGVPVCATHPGWARTPGVESSLPRFERLTRPVLRGLAAGADTTTWLVAVEPQPTGGLWHDRRARPTHVLPRTRPGPGEVQRMWDWVVEQAGLPGADPS